MSASTSEPDTEPQGPVNEEENQQRGFFGWQPQLELKNTGSVARDHLASERTWLAYIRTSLTLVSTGVALVQLFTIANHSNPIPPSQTIQQFARPLGATLVSLGVIVCLIGVVRYFKVQSVMVQGLFPAARIHVQLVSAVLIIILAIIFGVLITVPR